MVELAKWHFDHPCSLALSGSAPGARVYGECRGVSASASSRCRDRSHRIAAMRIDAPASSARCERVPGQVLAPADRAADYRHAWIPGRDDHLVVYERTAVKTARIDWGPHLTSFFLFPCKISSPPSTRERRGSGRLHNAIRCRSGADLGRQIRSVAPPPHVSVGKHWHFA